VVMLVALGIMALAFVMMFTVVLKKMNQQLDVARGDSGPIPIVRPVATAPALPAPERRKVVRPKHARRSTRNASSPRS